MADRSRGRLEVSHLNSHYTEMMEGRYSFPLIAPLTIDSYLTMLSVKQGGIKYHFWVFDIT